MTQLRCAGTFAACRAQLALELKPAWPRGARGVAASGAAPGSAQETTMTFAGKFDIDRVWMAGGGSEWLFERGSGGPGTVFGPIPVPEGKKPTVFDYD